ncbi:hypothetical protein LUW74_14295 [Actinomadura madurae]|uniref:hypothetical protein n=1 Tax=Actinomadura madurae TaxID=1993 RepID=UPI002025F815|nr:hypothetical protein [Actinomadura madurae]URN04365.1 hypothetical protein LUW74_14295 [Actinomadura madurae]
MKKHRGDRRDLRLAVRQGLGGGERVPALVEQDEDAGQVGDALCRVEGLPGGLVGVQGRGHQGAGPLVGGGDGGLVQKLAERDDLAGRLLAELVLRGAVRRGEHRARHEKAFGLAADGRHAAAAPQEEAADAEDGQAGHPRAERDE